MSATDLQEIKNYWMKKYPNVQVIFYPQPDNLNYRGKMSTVKESIDLHAATIGELIGQGESFLRKVGKQ